MGWERLKLHRCLLALFVLLTLIACRVSLPMTAPKDQNAAAGSATTASIAAGKELSSSTDSSQAVFTPSPASLTASLVPTPATPTPTQTAPPTATVAPLEEIVAMVPAPSLVGNLIGDASEQAVQIILPPTYHSSNLRYPVVYFLPGFGSDTKGHSHYFDNTAVASLMESGAIQEMILVVPNGANLLGGSFYVNSPVTGDWEDFIVQDVVGYLDANFRTITSPEGRGIGGHSMGGYGAINLAMRHPDLFSAVYSLSPGLFDKHGLANSHMFADKKKPKAFLEHQRRLKDLPRDSAIQEMIHYEGALGFTVAYGAAFAPDPDGGPPFLKYPYTNVNGEIQRQPQIWALWDMGFGDWKNKLVEFQDNLAQLNGIVIDYGSQEIFPWIPDGSNYLAGLLKNAGLPVELHVFDGGHSDRIEERIQSIGLPFFSAILTKAN